MGRVGELALALYAMVSSDGALELFTPVSDEDHVDVAIGRRGAIPSIAIQVKASPGPDAQGLVEATASYAKGHVREHPAFLYAVLLMDGTAVRVAWVVPSPAFNRLAYRIAGDADEALEFRGHPDQVDRWSLFRIAPLDLGPHLLGVIDALEAAIPLEFLAESSGLVVGGRNSKVC